MLYFCSRITGAEECSTSERREVDYVYLPPPSPQPEGPKPQVSTQTPPNARQIFECKTCQKVFTSHQALGGHRLAIRKATKMMKYKTIEEESNNIIHQNNQAGFSHQNNQAWSSSKNMALTIVPIVGTSSQLPLPKKKPKVHECSICKRQFPSCQALGGHMHCHWRASTSRGPTVEPVSIIATELKQGVVAVD
ncbi:Zinc finger protein ZAT5 [Dendrobium catenatum]|uniref:Zinc finger protein ZAT5 n=1 Tax=Dendrobium catenatum TaxID=906689 RepID=A0A2I0VD47_9ASPA|nr:Zinc finger protein ZAT5 [Dendrobium catenatum]